MSINKDIRVMLCPSSSGPYLDNLSKEFRSLGTKVSFIPWFGKQMPYSIFCLILLRLRGFKILHLNWIPFNRLWQLRIVKRISNRLNIKMIWTIHNITPHVSQLGSEEMDELGMRIMISWADYGIVHSERVLKTIKTLYGNQLPLKIIHHGSYTDQVEIMDSQILRNKLGISEDNFVILFLGPNRWNKGIRVYLESVSKLPEGFIGVIAGHCPIPGIYKLISSYKEQYPDKFIIDLRYLSNIEISEYYAVSDILLMPFDQITTSGTIIEALSHARPVITTDKGDMYEWIRNGETGFLVDSTDEIIAILSGLKREDARRMGVNGYILSSSRTWRDAAISYVDLYKMISD